jgi:hypothetical protein
MSKRKIFEIEGLFLAEGLAKEHEDGHGKSPFHLSHWDPGLMIRLSIAHR